MRVTARTGLGAVMESKNPTALVVYGAKYFFLAKPDFLQEDIQKEVYHEICGRKGYLFIGISWQKLNSAFFT